MRVCPDCYALYGPDQDKCPKDGTATEDSADVLLGRTLGSYMVRSLIGEGGMGMVYTGEHTTIGRRVALKILRPELSLRDDIVERFVQEARAVNTIGHSNIVNIYDFGKTPYGSFYIVMEHLDGKTIRSILDEKGPLPLDTVRHVVMQMGAALAAAHAKGFIHRDVKPENIIVIESGRKVHVKLLDFGIAKLLTPDRASHTVTGSTMGTPQYMCPEQLEDAPFDHRADIYALAAVAYEMLTGGVPYPGRSHAEVRQRQLTQTPPPPSACREDIQLSRKLDAAILWAMSPDLNTRCSRMEDFLSAFQAGYESVDEEEQQPQAPQETPPGRLKTNIIIGSAVGLLALAVGAGTVFFLKGNDQPVTATRADAAVKKAPVDADVGKPLTEAQAVELAKKMVLEAFQSSRNQDREHVAKCLGKLKRKVMQQELRKALKDRHPSVRRAAALALASMEDKQAIGDLRAALKESVDITAVDMASALAQLGDPRGLTRLRKELASARNEYSKKYILHILGRLGDRSALAWKKLLSKRRLVNPRLRRKALGYLVLLGDAKAREELTEILDSEAWSGRIEAAQALAPADPARAQKVLRQALTQASAKDKVKAASLLAYFGDAKAAKILVESLQSSNSRARKECLLALGYLRSKGSMRILRTALRDRDHEVALAAAVALLGL